MWGKRHLKGVCHVGDSEVEVPHCEIHVFFFDFSIKFSKVLGKKVAWNPILDQLTNINRKKKIKMF